MSNLLKTGFTRLGVDPAATIVLPSWCYGGPLIVTAGLGHIHNDFERDAELIKLRASVEIPAAGAAIIVDWAVDDVALGLPLSIPIGQLTAYSYISARWPKDSALSVSVLQVGSSFPGDTLTASVRAG